MGGKHDGSYIKFVAGRPNVGDVFVKFSILEGVPHGPQIGESITTSLEWDGETIGTVITADPSHHQRQLLERSRRLIYRKSTWTTPSGWSGEMETHAPVVSRGSFVTSGDVAMLVFKSGNVLGTTTGGVFDNLTVGGDSQPPPPPLNQEPSAAVSTSPTSGNPPLTVTFDASSTKATPTAIVQPTRGISVTAGKARE